MIGGTAGRTTLNGEGLQHEDGHSHIQAGVIPSCITYDPTYAYEVAVIVQDGMKRMYQDQEDIFYYLTVMNENYVQPEMPEGVEEGIRKGIYQLDQVKGMGKAKVQLLSSGTIMLEVRKAAEILAADYGIDSTIFSATSFNELAREGQETDRVNMLHPEAVEVKAYITQQLEEGVLTVACTDYMKSYAEQVRAYIPGAYRVLGTDGFGRSDSRDNLRRHFEVNTGYVVVATLHELAKAGEIDRSLVTQAIAKFDIDVNKINPLLA
jgi:pyruvate dehydrogenase E1 component